MITIITCANKIPAGTIAEIMEYSVSMVLEHLSMDVKARITKLCNFLGQQFYPIHRIAKYNGLVYLQLKIQSITMSESLQTECRSRF